MLKASGWLILTSVSISPRIAATLKWKVFSDSTYIIMSAIFTINIQNIYILAYFDIITTMYYHTISTSLWKVSLCCCASTAANAAEASLPRTAMFAFSSCIFASAACSLATCSAVGDSLTRACLLEISSFWFIFENQFE